MFYSLSLWCHHVPVSPTIHMRGIDNDWFLLLNPDQTTLSDMAIQHLEHIEHMCISYNEAILNLHRYPLSTDLARPPKPNTARTPIRGRGDHLLAWRTILAVVDAPYLLLLTAYGGRCSVRHCLVVLPLTSPWHSGESAYLITITWNWSSGTIGSRSEVTPDWRVFSAQYSSDDSRYQ